MKSVREEAARWFARIGNVPPDHPDRGPFETWLAANPVHAAEYAASSRLWDDFESTARANALAQAVEKRNAAIEHADDARREARRSLLKRGALGLFLCGGAGALAWRALSAWNAQPLAQFVLATRVAQTARQALPDGSHVSLSAGSALDLTYYRDRREARLIRGEAIFDVAHAPDRPFIVDSGPARVTVLGTRFAVARFGDLARVSVEHGSVRVTGTAGRDAAIVLGAGDVAEAGGHDAPRRVGRNAADAFAWERGSLVFDGASLMEIAESLSRYRGLPVHAGASGHRITAVVQIADIEGFLRALPAIAPVRIESVDGASVILPR